MNHVTAYNLLTAELAAYRNLPFEEASQLVGERSSRSIHADDGQLYLLSLDVRWHNIDGSVVRITGSIVRADWGTPHDAIDETIVIQNPNP